ncbi:MAG: hypothetical protein U1A78_12985 [Polyangia bacterium]
MSGDGDSELQVRPGPDDPGDELGLQRRPVNLNRPLLWFMRLGIVAMLATSGVYLYQRYHRSDEQTELMRYVEVDVPALDQVQAPIVRRIESLLAARSLTAAEARRMLVDELTPDLVKLRRLAEAPLRASRTSEVTVLATEYRTIIEDLIDACRTAVRVIDDPKLGGAEGLAQVRTALRKAAERDHTWREHVAETTSRLRLLKRRP